jgi:AbrB family looped-hinge helix DNA binding protein
MQIAIVDNKCRVLIPKEERDQLELKPGDVVAIRLEEGVLHIRKVTDPFGAPAAAAVPEPDAGRTRRSRGIAGKTSRKP